MMPKIEREAILTESCYDQRFTFALFGDPSGIAERIGHKVKVTIEWEDPEPENEIDYCPIAPAPKFEG